MKFRRALSIILNAVAVIASLIGMFCLKQAFLDNGYILFLKYFTIFTNSLIILTGLISIGYYVDSFFKKKEDTTLPVFIYALRLITAVSAFITFGTVVGYLQYSTALKDLLPNDPLFWNNICHHYISTLAIIVSFVFFDIDKKYPFKASLFGPLHLAIYMAYAVPVCIINASIWGGAPYIFMDTTILSVPIVIVEIFGALIIGFLVSFLLWLLNRICFLIFIGEEVSKEETEEEKVIDEKVEVTEEDQNQVNDIIKTGYNGPRIYHVSKREDGKWQVRFANGKKAIKLFDTQAEAIVFAKKLAKSQDGSIRVHSLKGRIRKAN